MWFHNNHSLSPRVGLDAGVALSRDELAEILGLRVTQTAPNVWATPSVVVADLNAFPVSFPVMANLQNSPTAGFTNASDC